MYGYGPLETLFVFPKQESRQGAISAAERLARAFEAHERHERKFVREYREAVGKHDNPLVTFLLNLVISDEEKHHQIVRNIAETLDANLRWKTPRSSFPRLGKITAQERDELLQLTKEFIEEEKRGLSEYKTLIKTSEGYYDGLLTLLIRTIILDSEKHIMLLTFIDQQLRAVRPDPMATGSQPD